MSHGDSRTVALASVSLVIHHERGRKCKFKPFGFLGSRNINEHKGECGFYLDENTMSGRNAPDWLKWKDCPKCGRYEDPNRGIHLCQVCGSAQLVALVTQTQTQNALFQVDVSLLVKSPVQRKASRRRRTPR